MTFKKIIGKLHLWLGLSSGLVVFIISVTGCLYAFRQEIQDLTQLYRFTAVQNQAVLKPSVLQQIAEEKLPGKHAHSVTYNTDGRSAEVAFFNNNPSYYYIIYMNQYTGEVLKIKDMNKDFFRIVLMGHFYLWLPPDIGQPVVASATLIFILLIFTGLILWWPKSKNGLKQRFSVKWNAKWKRRNYDLHNVLGFYIFSIVLILALTGLVWGFQWFANSVYFAASGGKKKIDFYESSSDTTNSITSNTPAVDKIWFNMQKQYAPAASIEVHYPEDHKSTIGVNIKPDNSLFWNTDFIYFDQYTLKEVQVNHIWGRMHKAQFADKLLRMNYDIHIGAILGLPGKILAFCVSLICASLPVTGFLIWRGRKKKYKKENKEWQWSTERSQVEV